MEMKGKALYNLLRINWIEDPSIEVKPWQVEDYRALTDEQLYSRLENLGLVLTENSFLMYADNCDSPEELVECLCLDEEDLERQDQGLLIFCELWRRLLPDKQSLSLFCDELDRLIELYDQGPLEDEDLLQKALSDLEDILDETVDLGISEKQAFKDISHYCAHDLESFIYDYISDQIEEKNDLIASECLDSFYAYVGDQKRFDFLRARIFAESDVVEGNVLIARLLEELAEEPDLLLLLEIAHYLVNRGDVHLFMQAVRQALPLLTHEEELQYLLQLIANYYRCLDREEEEKVVEAFLKKRESHPLDQRIDPFDQAIQHMTSLVSKKP
jgi:hypothetical protein